MPRLANLPPGLARLGNRLPINYQQPRQPRQSDAWESWYSHRDWRNLRWSILVRDRFTCQLCQRVVANTSRLVCDHIVPHHGNVDAFWAGPFQTLCVDCHKGRKQREDRARA